MKYLNLVLTLIALCLVAAVVQLYSLEKLLKGSRESSQAVVGSNQALVNSNARLEAGMLDLKKEVSAVKESFSKR